MRHAGIDSGSRWLGLGIFDDGPPTHPLSYVFAKALTVGREVERAAPLLITPKDKTAADGSVTKREPYYLTTTREVTEEDECAVAAEVMGYLIAHGVECVTIEKVSRVNFSKGATTQGVAAQGTALGQTKGVYTRIAERCMARGIEVRYVLAATWRARLLPMVKAEAVLAARMRGVAPPEDTAIKRRGADLEPTMRMGIHGWPAGGTFKSDEIEHVCDAAGIVLSAMLPAHVSKRKTRTGSPRKRTPGPRKPRGTRGALDKKKQHERRIALRAERRPAREAARAATGCTCGLHRGRHRRECPRHNGRVPPAETDEQRAAREAKRIEREARAAVTAARAKRRARLAAHDLAVDGVTSRLGENNG